MSEQSTLTPDPHQIIKTIDPRINFDVERKYLTEQGCSDVVVVRYNALNYSNSDLTFYVTTSGPNTGIWRKMIITYQVALMDANPVSNPFNEGSILSQSPFSALNEGPRCYSLTSASNSVQCTINGQNIAWTPAELMPKIAPYNNYNNVYAESGYPILPPQFCANSGSGQVNYPRSEFVPYVNQYLPQNAVSNNIYNYGGVVLSPTGDSTDIQLTVSWTACEPVIISPFEWGANSDLHAALYGVNKLILQYSGIIPARFWSSQIYDYDSEGDYVFRNMVPNPEQVTFTTDGPLPLNIPITTTIQPGLFCYAPILSVLYFRPPDNYPIAPLISYPVYEINMYKTQGTYIPAGNSATVTSNTVPIYIVPQRIYIFAGQNTSQELSGAFPQTLYPYGAPITSCAASDVTGLITSVNLQWGNKSGILSNSDIYTLYSIARKNGSNIGFNQWSGGAYTGPDATNFDFTYQAIWERPSSACALAFDPAVDFGIDSTSGMMERTQFLATVTIVNQCVSGSPISGQNGERVSENHTYILYIVLVQDGILSVDTRNYMWSKTIGCLSREQAMSAPLVTSNKLWNRWSNLFGGMKHGIRMVMKKLKK
jgi:hypothetical protein